jgi:hypothetical protein
MNCIIEDRYGRLLFTDGFHHLGNKDVKKLKVFTDYGEASKQADKVGGSATFWNTYIEEQGIKRKHQREKMQNDREEALANARVVDIPTRREWRIKDNARDSDLYWFDWFIPIRTLLTDDGWPIGVIGEVPDLCSIHCYTFEELDLAKECYEVVQ